MPDTLYVVAEIIALYVQVLCRASALSDHGSMPWLDECRDKTADKTLHPLFNFNKAGKPD